MKPTIILQSAIALIISCAQAAETNTTTRPLASSMTTNLLLDKVVAKSKSFQIKRSQVEEIYARIIPSVAARQQFVTDDKRASVEAKILDRLIVTQLLIRRANAEERAKAKKLCDNLVTQKIKRAITEEAFTRQLAAQGMTLEQYKVSTIESIICAAVIARETKSNVTVTDEQAKKFYAENGSQFEEPERVRASQILIGTRNPATGIELSEDEKKERRQLADMLLDRARKGEDFAKLAKMYSDDPGSRDKGGEYVFSRGEMMAQIENGAFNLKEGKISDIVTSPYGYHIIKLSERFPIKKAAYIDVAEDIKRQLRDEGIQKKRSDYIAKLKKDDSVEIVDAKAMGNP